MTIPTFFAGMVPTADELQALVLPPAVTDRQDAAITGITSTSYATGSPVCGVVFVAPPSGRVWINIAAQLDFDSGTRETVAAFRVGHAEDLGLGGPVFGPSDNVSLSKEAGCRDRSDVGHLLDGLTPGNVYNVVLMHKVTAGTTGTGRIARRQITVIPTW